MITVTIPAAARQKIIEVIDSIVAAPTETVVLDNDLDDCYASLDELGTELAVELDITGTVTLPVGAFLEIQVKKVDEATGTFTNVGFDLTVDSAGQTTLVIKPSDHAVTEGCSNFLIYFIAKYPNSSRQRILLIKAFMICDKCKDPDEHNQESETNSQTAG